MFKILFCFRNFQDFENPRQRFAALKIILRHFIKTIGRSFKTATVAVIPVNTYFWSKSVEHDVILTSFVAEL